MTAERAHHPARPLSPNQAYDICVCSVTVAALSRVAAALAPAHVQRKSSNIVELFDLIDSDKSGTISKEDFDGAMRRVGLDQLRTLQVSLSRNELSRTSSRVDESTEETLESAASTVCFRSRFTTT